MGMQHSRGERKQRWNNSRSNQQSSCQQSSITHEQQLATPATQGSAALWIAKEDACLKASCTSGELHVLTDQ
jgi:hypothetical protein